MGLTGSTPAEELQRAKQGFHVIKVAPNSPGEKAGIEPFFDYIVAVNEHVLVRLSSSLSLCSFRVRLSAV